MDKGDIERKTYNSYHIPSCSNIQKRKINAIFFNPTNTLEHELAKAKVCYSILLQGKKFVTEAVRNQRDKNGVHRRIDVVCLSDGCEFECVHRHESDAEVKAYREEGVIAVIVDPMICTVCGGEYPRRSKKLVCQLCKK